MTDAAVPTRVLFVCLGNICRSPLAEGLFLHVAQQRGLAHRVQADSCGTGHWHVGQRPDARALEVAHRHGVHLPSIGRQLDPERDFASFDWVVPMDRSNLRDLLRLGARPERTRLMMSFHPNHAGDIHPTLSAPMGTHAAPRPAHDGSGLDVHDPYTEDVRAFEAVFALLRPAVEELLRRVTGGFPADHGRSRG